MVPMAKRGSTMTGSSNKGDVISRAGDARDDQPRPVDRRSFLAGAAVGAAAFVTASPASGSSTASDEAGGVEPSILSTEDSERPSTLVPTQAQLAAEEGPPPGPPNPCIVENPASDWMVDVLKKLEFEYVTTNPGSSFKGLHESLLNHGG